MSSSFGIGEWFPNLVFDIVGRLLPGMVLLMLLALAFLGPGQFNADFLPLVTASGEFPPAATLVILLLGSIAYFLAILLRGVYYAIPFFRNRDDMGSDYSQKIDFIRIKAPQLAARVSKMQAEKHMMGVMQIGLMLVFLVNVMTAFRKPPIPHIVMAFLCILLWIPIEFLWRHLKQRMNTATNNFHELLAREK